MSDDLALKIYDVTRSEWARCERVARQYLEEYPNRVGWRDFVAYFEHGRTDSGLIVYRTKTMVVVRGCV